MRTLMGVVALSVGLSAIGVADQERLPPVPRDAMQASVDDISNSPEKYYGKTVRVVEDVARILAPRIFTLDEETPLGMGKDVMVVAPKGVTVREDEDYEVVGVVREFQWTELEKEKFDFDLHREWQTSFKSRPVIYATSVRRAGTR